MQIKRPFSTLDEIVPLNKNISSSLFCILLIPCSEIDNLFCCSLINPLEAFILKFINPLFLSHMRNVVILYLVL